MHRQQLSLILLVMLLAGLPSMPVSARSDQQAVPGKRSSRQLIIKLNGIANPIVDILVRLPLLSQIVGHTLAYVRTIATGAFVLRLADPADTADMDLVAQTLRRYAGLLDIEYVEADRIVEISFDPGDPGYSQQWNLQTGISNTHGINLAGAWDITTGSDSIIVAVVDTGIQLEHPEFAGRLLTGYDFIQDTPTSNDGDGRDGNASNPGDWVTEAEADGTIYRGCAVRNSTWHGTHVAGIIGATGHNGSGIAGIDWKTKLLPVRVLGKCGGYVSDIADGILWAAGFTVPDAPANLTPANVINLSLGSVGTCSISEQFAVTTAIKLGAIIVAAAGNRNANAASESPANCVGVVVVAATDQFGNKAYYSNYGALVTLSAPGGDNSGSASAGIYSTMEVGSQNPQGEGYGYLAGTSMAAPHVAGVLSLMLAVNPALTSVEATLLLRSSATPFASGSSCKSSACGIGSLNAAAAVYAARAEIVNSKTYLPLVM